MEKDRWDRLTHYATEAGEYRELTNQTIDQVLDLIHKSSKTGKDEDGWSEREAMMFKNQDESC